MKNDTYIPLYKALFDYPLNLRGTFLREAERRDLIRQVMDIPVENKASEGPDIDQGS